MFGNIVVIVTIFITFWPHALAADTSPTVIYDHRRSNWFLMICTKRFLETLKKKEKTSATALPERYERSKHAEEEEEEKEKEKALI